MKDPIRRFRFFIQWTSLFGAPLLAFLAYLLLPDAYTGDSGRAILFTQAGRATAALAVWMAIWWITEAIPVYATGLLPLALLPMAGAGTIRQVASPYGHELIFLFMGGFIIALAMQRWGLHKRLALATLRLVGSRPDRIVLGFMLVTAALSMWVSNTATTIMMLPIALSVIGLVLKEPSTRTRSTGDPFSDKNGRNFALSLLLGVAYAASIGGIGTLIGTPPNLFLASYIENNLGLEISFARWMGIGVPLVLVFVPLAWLVLTRFQFPVPTGAIAAGGSHIRDAHRGLGLMKRGEWATLGVFLATAAMWIFRPVLTRLEWGDVHPLAGLSDPGIAMIAALALFVIPVDFGKRIFAMDWKTAVQLPWGLLILFGGGLSLAAAIETNGVAAFLGHQVKAMEGWPSLYLVLAVTAMMIYLTEITSNTATTAALVPILAALAPGLGLHPFMLIVPAAIAASCAFMLPVATPPNAIVFGAGHVTIPEMVRAGFWLNLIGIVLITLLTYFIAMPLLGVGG